MSSSDRRAFLTALAALPLAACGFTPAYGPGGAAAFMGQVRVDPPVDRDSFALVGRLEERLDRAGPGADYGLAVRLEIRKEAVAITAANEIDRFNLLGLARFSLRDMSTGQVIETGQVENFTSYSATGSTVGTLSAERDAAERLSRTLADQIVTRLLAGAAGRRA